MSGKYDLNIYLIPGVKIKGYTEVIFSYSGTKVGRNPRRPGKALGLKAAWNLEFGTTHMFGRKSAGLRAEVLNSGLALV